MKVVFALVRGALAGALVLVLGVFLYRSYILYASGASLTAVPLPEMLLDVMALHHYAAIGAGVGAAVSALVRLWSLWTERRRHLAGALAERVGVVGRGQRVVIHDAVDRVEVALQPDGVADQAQVVAEMDDAGRLDPAEDPRRRRRELGVGAHGGRV